MVKGGWLMWRDYTANGGPWVLIEVELKRDDPVGNVVKIWQWAKQRKIKTKIVMFQAFSKHYWEKRTRLRLRAEFIGNEMMRDRDITVRYKRLTMKNYKPGKGKTQGAGRRTHHAQRLAETVLRLIRKRSLASFFTNTNARTNYRADWPHWMITAHSLLWGNVAEHVNLLLIVSSHASLLIIS
jgi:hypothetical protein